MSRVQFCRTESTVPLKRDDPPRWHMRWPVLPPACADAVPASDPLLMDG